MILLPDSIRNYMTKFLSDDWMIDNNFLDFDEMKNEDKENDKGWWYNDTVASLNVSPPITMSSNHYIL